MAAQFDTLVSEHQISRCTLQAVTKIVDEHLNQHNSGKAKSHIKAGLPGNGRVCKATQNHKGQKNWHFGQNGLQKRTNKCALNTVLITAGKFQYS